MTPLLDASFAIVLHAFAAMTAFVLGMVQLAGPKWTLPHRVLGWTCAALMLAVALLAAHRHQVARHRKGMILLFTGAPVIAGVFTLYPGRIMHRVVFGG